MESSQNDRARAAARDEVVSATGFSVSSGTATDPIDLAGAVDRARRYLLTLQHPDGYWCGELQGDSILESEYILLLAWLGQLDRPVVSQAARYLARQQLRQGGWALFPGGEMDLSASVKAYFAMKLAGHDVRSEPMRLAREAIVAHGGADAVNSFTRFYLALLGQIPFDACPAVMPEAVLLPSWSPINIYRISSWSRAILVPLSIVWAHRPSRPVSSELGIQELFLKPVHRWPALRSPGVEPPRGWLNWDRFFRGLDAALKRLERARIRPLRRAALRAAERWMTERFVDSDGLGAIFPPIVWSLIALKCLGYDDQSAEVRYCHEQLEDLVIEQEDTAQEDTAQEDTAQEDTAQEDTAQEDEGMVRLQPCKSPVWDTALTLRALAAASREADESAVGRATQWLVAREATRKGDWAVRVKAEPGGWFFEHHNAFYPDLDDTAVVVTALREHYVKDTASHGSRSVDPRAGRLVLLTTTPSMPEARERALLLDRAMDACDRARDWMRAMQNADGGWGAFDRDNDAAFLCHVPFADHNAMIDPSTPDITGRVLEALASWGARLDDPAVARAVRYLRATQEADGSWSGRWGVNHIYGTWQCLVGLRAVGLAPRDPCVRRGVEWLARHQQESGGWGESPESYSRPELRGHGPATPSQTAWALLGLIACDWHEQPAVRRGIAFLIRTQRSDGDWDEPEFTGTGFPRVFYLRYHMYPLYFPLLALGRFQQALTETGQ